MGPGIRTLYRGAIIQFKSNGHFMQGKTGFHTGQTFWGFQLGENMVY
jgi:hypothetical protein